MDAKLLITARKQAEDAVKEMPDGDLKVKAFEVILSHMLSTLVTKSSSGAGTAVAQEVPAKKSGRRAAGAAKPRTSKATASGRILVLRDEGYFGSQRTIGEVREELSAHGWHYPVTSLSGTMQSLVRQQELRRVRVADGQKKIWKYSNW
jgi:hypothetical protein